MAGPGYYARVLAGLAAPRITAATPLVSRITGPEAARSE
jgi:hypothetical protein